MEDLILMFVILDFTISSVGLMLLTSIAWRNILDMKQIKDKLGIKDFRL